MSSTVQKLIQAHSFIAHFIDKQQQQQSIFALETRS